MFACWKISIFIIGETFKEPIKNLFFFFAKKVWSKWIKLWFKSQIIAQYSMFYWISPTCQEVPLESLLENP